MNSAVLTIGLTLALSGQPQAGDVMQPSEDEYVEMFEDHYTFVCPDGRYQSGCDQEAKEDHIEALLADAKPEDFSEICFYRTVAECSVAQSGIIAQGNEPLHWQHLKISPPDGPAVEMIVAAQFSNAGPSLLMSQQVEGFFAAPPAYSLSDGGMLVHTAARNRGLGGADYLLWDAGDGWHWRQSTDIERTVNALLPEGFSVAGPFNFTWTEMTANALVRREMDAGCCPTGGTVIVTFAAGPYTLDVEEIAFRPSTPGGAVVRARRTGFENGEAE